MDKQKQKKKHKNLHYIQEYRRNENAIPFLKHLVRLARICLAVKAFLYTCRQEMLPRKYLLSLILAPILTG